MAIDIDTNDNRKDTWLLELHSYIYISCNDQDKSYLFDQFEEISKP